MTSLAAILLAPERRERVARSVAGWIDAYVAALGGFKGLGLKAGLGALKAMRPDGLYRGIHRLLPEFVAALEPLFQRCCAADEKNFGKFLATHVEEATAAIMATVDARAASGAYPGLAPIYRRLRGTVQAELRATLPKLVDRIGAIATSEGNDAL